mgnify:CR=1 FL=1
MAHLPFVWEEINLAYCKTILFWMRICYTSYKVADVVIAPIIYWITKENVYETGRE